MLNTSTVFLIMLHVPVMSYAVYIYVLPGSPVNMIIYSNVGAH